MCASRLSFAQLHLVGVGGREGGREDGGQGWLWITPAQNLSLCLLFAGTSYRQTHRCSECRAGYCRSWNRVFARLASRASSASRCRSRNNPCKGECVLPTGVKGSQRSCLQQRRYLCVPNADVGRHLASGRSADDRQRCSQGVTSQCQKRPNRAPPGRECPAQLPKKPPLDALAEHITQREGMLRCVQRHFINCDMADTSWLFCACWRCSSKPASTSHYSSQVLMQRPLSPPAISMAFVLLITWT